MSLAAILLSCAVLSPAWAGQPTAPAKPAAPVTPEKAPPKSGGDSKPETKAEPKTEPRTDEWWKKMHDQFLARTKQAAAAGDIGVLFIGDSITQGWGGAGKAAWGEKFAGFKPANYGIGGDKTGHVLWRIRNGEFDGLAKPAAGSPPSVVVLMIGTNDIGTGATPESASAGIKACVAAIREKLPEAKVLVLGVLPRSENPDALREKVKRTNELAKDVADGKQVIWQDDWAQFIREDGTIDKAIMPDQLHLSEAGYARWAGLIAPSLEKLAKK